VAPVFHTPTEYGYVNPLGTTNISTIINNIIKTALGFVGALFLAMFVYGGARWMTAGGEEKNVQSAKNTIRNAVIGMLVIALSYGIISLIFQTASQIQAPVAPTPGQGCIRSSDCSDITATCESGICVSSLRAP
jgi:cytochrome bd-type quinol oxidase subunit 2